MTNIWKPIKKFRNFLDLEDTPGSYSGQGGKYTKVKSTEDGLEFGTIPASDYPEAFLKDGSRVATGDFDLNNHSLKRAWKFTDVNDKCVLELAYPDNPANYIGLMAEVLGSRPVIFAEGLDTNIDLGLFPKGTGAVNANTKNIKNFTKLYFTGGYPWLTYGTDDILKITTPASYLEIGPKSADYCHLLTGASRFYLNKQTEIDGHLIPYGGTKTKQLGEESRIWLTLWARSAHIQYDSGHWILLDPYYASAYHTIRTKGTLFFRINDIGYTHYFKSSGDFGCAAITRYPSGNYIQVNTDNGYVQLGPQNVNWCHFKTDRGKYYFDKQIWIAGHCVPYVGNAYSLGSSTRKWEYIYRSDEITCDLPTSNSAIDVMKKIKKPVLKKGDYGRRHYFDYKKFPKEMKTKNDKGELDIELTRVTGVLVQAVREIIDRLEKLEKVK